jgi:hypothetical protein
VAGALRIRFLNRDHHAVLRDISAEGFALLTSDPIPVGTRCFFALGPDEARGRLVSARAVYCTARTQIGGYVSGWATDDNEVTKGAMQSALEHLTAGLTFDDEE